MNSDQRYNRDQISKILKRAAELEHQYNIEDDSEGLTVGELEQVSKDVGLHPQYIQQAVNELQHPAQKIRSNLFGGPFTYYFSDSVKGTFTDTEWEKIVSEIRRIHGGIGKTSKLGRTFEWEQRKKEIGYIQISLSPQKDHTEISINANYNYFAFIVSLLMGVACIPLFILLASAVDSLQPAAEIFVFVPIIALIVGVRFYLSYWMKKKRKKYHTLFKRFRGMLTSEKTSEQKQHTPSPAIQFPSEVPEEQESTIASDPQRKNIGN